MENIYLKILLSGLLRIGKILRFAPLSLQSVFLPAVLLPFNLLNWEDMTLLCTIIVVSALFFTLSNSHTKYQVSKKQNWFHLLPPFLYYFLLWEIFGFSISWAWAIIYHHGTLKLFGGPRSYYLCFPFGAKSCARSRPRRWKNNMFSTTSTIGGVLESTGKITCR